jgi:hypothetical protein
MNNLFILGYSAINYFESWYKHENYPNTKLWILDNNRQEIPEYFKSNIVYTTSRNIGCSGGWNLICDIGFKHFGLDAIIIGQEDARFSEEILDAITQMTSPDTIVGTYNNSFEFSLYGIHRETFNKVGRFDENFIFAGCEDNDYKHRCKLNNVDIQCLGIPHTFNANATTYEGSPYIPNPIRKYNETYVHEKWGHYNYSVPFNKAPTEKYTKTFMEIYGELDQWPSELEYQKYLNRNENSIS